MNSVPSVGRRRDASRGERSESVDNAECGNLIQVWHWILSPPLHALHKLEPSHPATAVDVCIPLPLSSLFSIFLNMYLQQINCQNLFIFICLICFLFCFQPTHILCLCPVVLDFLLWQFFTWPQSCCTSQPCTPPPRVFLKKRIIPQYFHLAEICFQGMPNVSGSVVCVGGGLRSHLSTWCVTELLWDAGTAHRAVVDSAP